MSGRALEANDLSGGYPGLTIFRDLSLTLPVGRIVGICGPNGAGKTTLLKTLAGLLPASRGRVLFGGQDITTTKAFERAKFGLVLVPEGRLIFNSLSVRQNAELCKAAGRLTKLDFSERFEGVLTSFPRLRERLDQPGGSLSGGEQQMLAIGRALLLDPMVLMLDEPTQGLAPVMVRQVLTVLHGLRGKLSMIVVEQNRGFLEELVDVAYDMRSGEISAPK